jgi:hypothetical protein
LWEGIGVILFLSILSIEIIYYNQAFQNDFPKVLGRFGTLLSRRVQK